MKWRLLAACAVLPAAAPQAGTYAVPSVLTVGSGVVDGARSDSGLIWFHSWSEGVGFLIQARTRADSDTAFRMLTDAAQSSEMLLVRFEPASGRYDPARRRIMYRACALRSGAVAFGDGDAFCRGHAADQKPTEAERILALGVALQEAGRGRDAAPLLDRSLGQDLDDGRRLIGLRARQGAREAAALLLSPSRARDEALAAALADARAWAGLAPDDHDAALAVAADLALLGGYDESIAAYRAIEQRWPGEAYRVAVRIGAIRRGHGDYAGALASLDGLVAAHGAQTGMKFHYHRGWTLSLLGRDEEAVTELSAGLRDQPDYAWARIRRACSLARLGRIADAAADQRAGLARIEQAAPALGDLPDDARADIAHARAVAAALERQAATRPTMATDLACTGYADPDRKRERSVLLP